MKIKKVPTSRVHFQYQFMCPGCNCTHAFVESVHSWNKDYESPTLSPSFLMNWDRDGKPYVCHSFIQDGRIQFLNDCTHDLKGRTVYLPDIE